MLVALMSLMMSVGLAIAKTDACSLTEILKATSPDKKCVEAYLAKIPNGEDRSEAKFRLQQWKPIKDLQVISEDGMIEAYSGKKLLIRTLLLQKQNPMLIWMDGKILVDNSDNPSFVRRLDNSMKKNKSALMSFVIPPAHAEPPIENTQQTLTMLYALNEPNVWGDAETVVTGSQKLQAFLPARGWLSKKLSGVKELRCGANMTVEGTEFRQSGSYTDVDTVLKITPKGPTEFVITGLKRGQSHLIKLSSWDASVRGRNQKQPMLGLKSAAVDASLSTCADAGCTSFTKTEGFDKWNFILRKSPEQEAKRRERSLKANRETMDDLNKEFRTELVGKLFGLSVMGNCCTTQACREKMTERFGIQLKPESSAPSTTN